MDIPITKPYFPEEDVQTILKHAENILRSGRLIGGPFVKQFEEEFAGACGTRYAAAVNSATSALQIALQYFHVSGKEVITPVNTFLATSNAVLYAGGTPVLADIHPETLCLDPRELERRITRRTVGVIVVHLAGLVTPHIKEIRDICRRRHLFLIEDAAHAHGASAYGVAAGAWGDAAVFSFLATKVITTGGVGGILATNQKKLDMLARSLRFHGEDKTRGVQDRLGYDWLLSELQALIGLVQTQRLREIVEKRMAVGRLYHEAFREMKKVQPFAVPEGFRHSYYKYPLLLQKPLKRPNVVNRLGALGIAIGTSYWPPCHLQPVYRKMFGYKKGDFPVAEEVLNQTISLPMFTAMTLREVAYVVKSVQRVCG